MDVLYLWMCFVERKFCREGRYVEERFVDGRFVEGRFVEGRFVLVPQILPATAIIFLHPVKTTICHFQ